MPIFSKPMVPFTEATLQALIDEKIPVFPEFAAMLDDLFNAMQPSTFGFEAALTALFTATFQTKDAPLLTGKAVWILTGLGSGKARAILSTGSLLDKPILSTDNKWVKLAKQLAQAAAAAISVRHGICADLHSRSAYSIPATQAHYTGADAVDLSTLLLYVVKGGFAAHADHKEYHVRFILHLGASAAQIIFHPIGVENVKASITLQSGTAYGLPIAIGGATDSGGEHELYHLRLASDTPSCGIIADLISLPEMEVVEGAPTE